MNPLLALALVAAAGIALTRLPLPRLRHTPSLDLVLAAGAPLVLLGLLLGPGLGVLDRPALRALAPVTALGIGWVGAVFGARLEWRFLRRIPPAVWRLAALQAAIVFVLTALAAWLLMRRVPALAAAWRPALPAVLTLAAAATVSGPGAVALVARAAGARRSVAKAFGVAAVLDSAFGALAFVLALALSHPREAFADLAVAVAASGGVGILFLWLARLRPDATELGLDLLGVMLFGAGVGYAAGLSPFVVCALATALIVNLSPHKRRVQVLLDAWEHPIYAVFLIVAGALLVLPTPWLAPAALALTLVRVAARWAAGGLGTIAQGGIAVALGLSFHLTYGGVYPRAGAISTTVLLGLALAQAAARPLMALALRPARQEVR